jgi:hypothetical protein
MSTELGFLSSGDPGFFSFLLKSKQSSSRNTDLGYLWSQVDQEKQVDVAGKHGLSALLYSELHENKVRLRPTAQTKLRKNALALLSSGAHIERLTKMVLATLGAEGIIPILLKGFGLGSRLYACNPHVRPSSDVDVVVWPQELPRAIRAFQRLGFAQHSSESFDLDHHHHVAMSRGNELIEIHFQLFSGLGTQALDAQHFFSRARTDELLGQKVRYLLPEDELLYLSVHAANHGFLRLFWLLDLATFMQTTVVDLHAVSALAKRGHLRRALALALCLANRYFGADNALEIAQSFGDVRGLELLSKTLFTNRLLESAALSQHRQAAVALRLAILDDGFQAIRAIRDGVSRAFARESSLGKPFEKS